MSRRVNGKARRQLYRHRDVFASDVDKRPSHEPWSGIAAGTQIIWRPDAVPLVEVLQVRGTDMRCGMFQDRYMVGLSGANARCIRYGHRVVEQEQEGFLLIEPGDVHQSLSASSTEAMDVMFIDPSIVRRVGRIQGLDAVHWSVLTVRDAELASDFHTALVTLGGDDTELARASFERFINRAVQRYGRRVAPPSRVAVTRGLVRAAREILEQRMADQITVEEIANELGVTLCHLVRCFSADLGTPPHRYRVHLRVERARGLLASGLSLVDSAHAVGFADQSHLHRHFTKILGVTPGEYVRLLRRHGVSRTRCVS